MHRRLKTLSLATGAVAMCLGLCAVSGCGSAPPIPKELADARVSYTRASLGPAQKLAPAQLDTAKQALARAESACKDDPGAEESRDLAYIAERKALLAEVAAATEEAQRNKLRAEKDFKELSQEQLTRAQEELRRGKEQVQPERNGPEVADTARTQPERIPNPALASLRELGAVKEEKRGVVITLSGAQLFPAGKADLLPLAKEKLLQIVQALKEQGSPTLRIEGHSDSKGSADENRKLSFARAQRVKEYLAKEGLRYNKIYAVGHGPDRPVADNATPEGRANNRRVEIVVSPTDP
jgi:outer membrane protein OmpA-like peptidoglycan-associated protein